MSGRLGCKSFDWYMENVATEAPCLAAVFGMGGKSKKNLEIVVQ